jgi:hypothetical protein
VPTQEVPDVMSAIFSARKASLAVFANAHAGATDAYDTERRAQCRLLRDLCGNPFRPTVLDPGWRTPAVVAIAGASYDDRDFTALPILADALEDAGCGDAIVLEHCRQTADHARGCWVIDGLLRKA